MADPVIVICGPTATGKSDLAQSLAEDATGVVLSADSMQVYRGMDIGTAKVPVQEQRVQHFGLDLTDPDRAYSAALYQAYGREIIAQMSAVGTPVVMAGGTGLYIQAVLDDLDFPQGEQEDNPVREYYMALAKEQGAQRAWDALQKLDPASAAEIHPNNVKRVVRAIEMHHAGESYAERAHSLKETSSVIPAIQIGLTLNRPLLYERINERVDRMREAGLIEEVLRLVDAGFADSITARQAIGYKEVLAALAGHITLDEAFEQIKQASRRYAKRQMTWFKRDERIYWIDITDKGPEDIIEATQAHLAEQRLRNGV